MKAYFCGLCMDVRGVRKEPTSCTCGNVSARWINPLTGTVVVKAINQGMARIIGLHNGWIQHSFSDPHPTRHDRWREKTRELCENAQGYMFHTSMRNSPVVMIQVGESNDTFWESDAHKVFKDDETVS